MNFKNEQRLRSEFLIKSGSFFGDDSGCGKFRNKQYPFVLQSAQNNLYAPFRDEIKEYFTNNKIAWWGGSEPTNHTLSSQIACVNHLFPIRQDKEAVLSMIKQFIPDIIDILSIKSDKHNPGYIQFESVSDTNHLNEGRTTRGCNCTSVDALAYGKYKDERKILILIEWKYAEVYGNASMSNGDSGAARKGRYADLINKSYQLKIDSHDIYNYEPFYQLMRQTLWAEQMIAHKDSETVKADDYIHLHIIPEGNHQLLRKNYKCSGKSMEETWRQCLKNQNKYRRLSPQCLLAPIDSRKHKGMFDYLQARYW